MSGRRYARPVPDSFITEWLIQRDGGLPCGKKEKTVNAVLLFFISVNSKDDQIKTDTKKLSRNEEAKHVLIRFKEPEDSRIAHKYPKNIILLSVVSMYFFKLTHFAVH